MADATLTQEYLHKMYEYRDGVLYKKPQTKRCKPNLKPGTLKDGYIRMAINYKYYYAHRLIYMMFYGEMPKQIDHIDGNRSNNKIENLRKADNTKNSFNKNKTKANTSGIKNVYWDKNCKKWCVLIQAHGIKKYLGLYKDLELAELVAIEARNKFHGKFANHS